jgi:hypothetical protein
MEKRKVACSFLVRKPEERRRIGRPRRRWEDNVKMALQEVDLGIN